MLALALLLPVAPQGMSAPIPPGSTVAVTGPTGKLGRLAVKQLVAEGYKARCLLRHDVASAGEASGAPDAPKEAVAAWLMAMPGVEFCKGDVTDRASVDELLKGCSAVLALHGARRMTKPADLLPWSNPESDPTHSKRVNYDGVRNLVEAAAASGTCTRIVRVTGKGEDPFSPFSILINGLGSMAKAFNYEGEALLRKEGARVPYTVVRPGIMGAGDETLGEDRALALADNGGDLPVSRIPHACVAQLCVASLAHGNAARATLTAMTVPRGEGELSWAPLLARVKPDTRQFPATLLAKHRLAVRVGGGAIACAMLAAAAGAWKAAAAALGLLAKGARALRT